MRFKLILGAFLGLFVGVCKADTTTSNMGLVEPSIGSMGWGAKTNANWGIVDSSAACLACANTFTSTNTFNYPLLIRNNNALRLYDLTSHYIELRASPTVSTTQFILPSQDGTSGQGLITNGAGTLSFAAISGGGVSTLGVSQSSVSISSPTKVINFIGPPFLVTLVSGNTAQVTLNPSSVTLQGNMFNQASKLVQLDSSARLPAVDGSQLTNLPSSGGGGGASGQINSASQFSALYYSVSGSSNVVSAFPGMTMSTNTGVNLSTMTVSSFTASALAAGTILNHAFVDNGGGGTWGGIAYTDIAQGLQNNGNIRVNTGMGIDQIGITIGADPSGFGSPYSTGVYVNGTHALALGNDWTGLNVVSDQTGNNNGIVFNIINGTVNNAIRIDSGTIQTPLKNTLIAADSNGFFVSTTTAGGVSLSSTNTWTAGQTFQSSTTLSGKIVLSSTVISGGTAGTGNQVLTSSGTAGPPYWAAGSGGITTLTGDVIASGTGSVAATLAASQPNVVTLTRSSITVSGANGLLVTSSITVAGSTQTTRLNLGNPTDTTASTGLNFGNATTNLYQTATMGIKTDGALTIQNLLTANNGVTVAGGNQTFTNAASITGNTLTINGGTAANSILNMASTNSNPGAADRISFFVGTSGLKEVVRMADWGNGSGGGVALGSATAPTATLQVVSVSTIPAYALTVSTSNPGMLDIAVSTIAGGVTINSTTTLNSSTLIISTFANTSALVVQSSTALNVVSIDNTLPVAGDFLINVSSVPGGSGPMLFGVNTYGQQISSGTTPTISSCGSTPNGSVSGTDQLGTITVGGGVVTSCVLTPQNPCINNNLTCVVTDNSTTVAVSISAQSKSSNTFSTPSTLGGGLIFYWCGCPKG